MDSTLGPYIATVIVGLLGTVGVIYTARRNADATIQKTKEEARQTASVETNKVIGEREARLYAEQDRLRDELREELDRRTKANEAAIADLQGELEQTRKVEQQLRQEIERQANALTTLTLENQKLRGENLRLRREVAELRKQMGTTP